MLNTGAYRHLPSPSFILALYTTRAHRPTPKTRTWQGPSFLQIMTALFCLKFRSKAPGGMGLAHARQNLRGDGPPSSHNTPSSFAQRTTSSADKMAASFRLRNYQIFGGSRANQLRPGSKAWARIFSKGPTVRSAFLANSLHKTGSPRRRAPGASQRDGCSRVLADRLYISTKHTSFSLRRTNHLLACAESSCEGTNLLGTRLRVANEAVGTREYMSL